MNKLERDYWIEDDTLYGVGLDAPVLRVPDTVRVLGASCLMDSRVQRLILPEGVREILMSAMTDCHHLQEVELPGTLEAIGDGAMEGCASLQRIVIPRGVQRMGADVFEGCSPQLVIGVEATKQQVEAMCALPDGWSPDWNSQGYPVVYDCTHAGWDVAPQEAPPVPRDPYLVRRGVLAAYRGADDVVVVPEGVHTLATGVMGWMPWSRHLVRRVVLPYSLRVMGKMALCDQWRMQQLVIPEGLVRIEDAALRHCEALTTLCLPSTVTHIGQDALCGCRALRTIQVAEGNPVYHSQDNCLIDTQARVLLRGGADSRLPTDGSVTAIGEGAWDYCDDLTALVVPGAVHTVGRRAMAGCCALTTVTLQEGVQQLLGSALSGCRALTGLHLPDTLTTIGDEALHLCDGLRTLYIPKGVRTMGHRVIWRCHEALVVYCEAQRQPAGWAKDWNIDGVTVVWGAPKQAD